MIGGFYFVMLLAASLITLLVVYGNKVTFTNYEGRGNNTTFVLAALAGIVGVYLLQLVTGVHYFADANTVFQFGTKFDNDTLNTATWLLFGGLAAVVGVGAFNTWRYGRVNM